MAFSSAPQEQQQPGAGAKALFLVLVSFALGAAVSLAVQEAFPDLLGGSSGDKEGRPDGQTSSATKHRVQEFWEAMHPGAAFPALTPRESELLSEVVLPADIGAAFGSIGGLQDILRDVMAHVLLPMRVPEFFYRADDPMGVSKPSRGILLWGPPGTGKTMIAKAIARESNSVFLNLTVSTIENKWFGESGKILAALFGLATKLAPSVVFFDEIDGMVRSRTESDAAHHTSLKTQLLSLLDGVTTTNAAVTFVGATNRADHLDSAVLRRLRRQIHVPLPNAPGREDILRKMLGKDADTVDCGAVADATEGFSGSDLNEACRAANMLRFIRHCEAAGVDVERVACCPDKGVAEEFRRKVADRAPPQLGTDTLLEAVASVKRCTAAGEPGYDGP